MVCGGVDPELARLGGLTSVTGADGNQAATAQAGIHKNDGIPAQAGIHLAKLTDASQSLAQHVPASFPTFHRLEKNEAEAGAQVVYEVDGNPVLTLNTSHGKHVLMWDPPDVMFKENAPLREDWGGSGAPYALVAGALNSLLAGTGALHAERIDLDQTLNVTAWRESDGVVRILAGNLEEGLRDDADMTRHTVLVLPNQWQTTKWADAWSAVTFEANHHRLRIDLDQAGSALLQSTR